ncbi:dTDP-4-dehydrorhamnose reductase [Polaribacter sp. KT 15]|uniref:dTDP-4-dehydrorhamnose reductase n=1 Tax=Polaribacter sp. KT 15 TaxID=1896175 RepID=UPI00090A1536|nr:dTDP-4-dehydrorhamnose reductase [Polaribacter sp. KT 15]SHN00802.1 dTDP-4-dehydrorhamnose reductase [Polaribacter sp. KT 15]
MSNILVTGANGQLGSELKNIEVDYSKYKFYFTDFNELDITDHDAVRRFVLNNNITIIINCAAHTAVDKAENEIELSDKLNHLSVKNFAELSKELKIKLIHVSTDYVFDGTNHRPYLESDITSPQSVYGKTKLDGENAMKKINPENSIIIRTSWVYSNYGNNFVKTMLRLGRERESIGVIYDQIGTPTYAGDLAKAILEIIPKINNNTVELFHYSNEGVCSWYDFAKTIFELKAIPCLVNAILTSDYPTAAKRPYYSLLNKDKIKQKFGLKVPYWKDSLKEVLGF